MRVILRTPEQEWAFSEAVSVSLITEGGAIQIYSGHATLQGSLLLSPLRIELPHGEEDFVIRRGVVCVDQEQDEVLILVYKAEQRASLDFETAEQYLQVLLRALEQRESLGPYQLAFLESEHAATVAFIAVKKHG